MSVFNVENTKGRPCRIFDNNAEEICFVVECNTDTGMVERLAHDGENFIVNAAGDAIERIFEIRAAPLHVLFFDAKKQRTARAN